MAGNGSGGFLATDVFAPLGADVSGGCLYPVTAMHVIWLCRDNIVTMALDQTFLGPCLQASPLTSRPDFAGP